jgi:hypothetical protein
MIPISRWMLCGAVSLLIAGTASAQTCSCRGSTAVRDKAQDQCDATCHKGESGPKKPGERDDSIERHIAQALEEKEVTVNFNNTPLEDAIRDVKALAGGNIRFIIDEPALLEAGIRKDQPVSFAVKGLTLRHVLNFIFYQSKLTWVIENQAITITTVAALRSRMQKTTVTYKVADLVAPVDNYILPAIKYWKKVYANPNATDPAPSAEDAMVWAIAHSIAPETWSEKGGIGTIQYCPMAKALVVKQTPDVQEEIADVLQALRRLYCQVCFKSKLVEKDSNGKTHATALPKITFYDEQQVHITHDLSTSGHDRVILTIRTQIKRDGKVDLSLCYFESGRVRPPLLNGREKTSVDGVHTVQPSRQCVACTGIWSSTSMTNCTVEFGQRNRLPLEESSDGQAWLEFTVQKVGD